MKKIIRLFPILLLSTLMLSISSCGDEEEVQDLLPQLTPIEVENLQFLREEEKLARDVYAHLGGLYDHIIFDNIEASEQRHIDFVLELMEKYDLSDNSTNEPGIFNNSDIQSLYNSLIDQGKNSLLDALIVGATIEDLDINDLDNAIDNTENMDLIGLYQLLQCGSRNHIRAFTSQVKQEGGNYIPTYISQDRLNEIIQLGHESCSQYM